MPIIKCQQCQRDFYAKPYLVRHGYGIFCSRACHHKGMTKRLGVVCAICSKAINLSPSQIARSNSGKFFCNKSCQTIWRNKEFVGSKHLRWRGGNTLYRKILEKSNQKKRCTRCSLKDTRVLAVHHIDKNKKNNKVENLVWMCHNCHYLIHYDKVEWLEFNKSRLDPK